jgi:hypothetical protein
MITGGLKQWQTGVALQVHDGKAIVKVEGKGIEIYAG